MQDFCRVATRRNERAVLVTSARFAYKAVAVRAWRAMRRWLWMIPLALLLAVVIADTAVWYVVVQQMRNGLDAWVAARRADGWTVSATAPEAGGWPIAATLTLRDLELRGGNADIPHGLSWRADRVELRLSPDDSKTLHIAAAGLQDIRIGDSPTIAYSADRLELLVPLQAPPDAQPLGLHGTALRAHVPVADATDMLTIASLDMDAVVDPTAGRGQSLLSITARAQTIDLPPRADWPLGPDIRALRIAATLQGPASDAPQLAARAAAWRDGGGALELQHVEAEWGPLALDGKGTLTLDPQLQPTGAATADVIGYAATLDALAQHGVLSNSAAVAAKAVLSLLAVAPKDGGPSEVEVPFSLQNDTLSMHQVPLMRLPELDWPPS